jgi:UDP-N-acetylmuramyl pentapeptide phosphotransferase/UDP-N-acetylglucosamine-1-phosphate transferase
MGILELNDWQALLLAFAGSMVISWYSLPKIIKVAKYRRLTDKPGKHKIHSSEIPTLGGVAIFGGFSFGLLLSGNGYMGSLAFLMVAVIMLFFIGLKDDLISVTPWKKIAVQVAAGLILFLFTDLKFTNLHGFLGIHQIPLWTSLVLTIFLIVIIINSFNLIDGIDGLAASVGIVASTTFGIWFWLSGDKGFAIASAALTGSLIIFLGFNLSTGKYKIFMGDTGSLVIGFILTVMAIRFNEINAGTSGFVKLNSSPSISIAILIVPLFDSLRVIIIRLIRHQPPMKADNRHIHHLLLRAGYSHKQATLYISLANIFIIAASFMLDWMGIFWLGFILLALCTLFTVPVYYMVAKRENWKMYKYKLWRLIISDNKEMEIYRSMWGIIHEYKVHPEGAHHVPIKDIKSTPEIPEKSVIIGNDHKN